MMTGDCLHISRCRRTVIPWEVYSPWWRGVACLGLMATCLFLMPLRLHGEDSSPFRIGFSTATFGDVNENDAMAAVRVWAQALAQERGIPADPQPKVFKNFTEIAEALNHKSVDCINITTNEYALLGKQVAGNTVVTALKGGVFTEEYVLLVHQTSGIATLAGLKGRTIGFLQSNRTSLSAIWLDTTLVRNGLGPATVFFKQILTQSKIDKAVLPVFFRQMDACMVTRHGFETMIELNPQIGQQLRILESSPPVVPVVFCFRTDYTSRLKDLILDEIARWHLSPAGRQILTVFQTDSLAELPSQVLDGTMELLAEHQRRLGHPSNVKDKADPPVSASGGK